VVATNVGSIWTVIALATPAVVRACPRCDRATRFHSSDKFRVNANQRRIDVWLIYRCGDCDATWNRAVERRRTVDDIGRDVYRRYQDNDRELAWRVGFDLEGLARLGAAADADVPVRVDHRGEAGGAVRIELAHPCRVRLDKLLAGELGISRSALRSLVAARDIDAGDPRALRRPVRDGTVVRIRAGVERVLSPGMLRQSITIAVLAVAAAAGACGSSGSSTAGLQVVPLGVELVGEDAATAERLDLSDARRRQGELREPEPAKGLRRGDQTWFLRAFDDDRLVFLQCRFEPPPPPSRPVKRRARWIVERRVTVPRSRRAVEQLRVADTIVQYEGGVCGVRRGMSKAALNERYGEPDSVMYPAAAGCLLEIYGELDVSVCHGAVTNVHLAAGASCPRSE
jgi:hypothetical protein